MFQNIVNNTTCKMNSSQGNLSGESVAAAILPSCMEQIIVPPDFFASKPAKKA